VLVLVALVLSGSAATTTTTTVRKSTTTTATTLPPAEVARQKAIDQQLTTLRQQVEEASAEEAEVLDKVDEVAAKRRSLEGQVQTLDAQIASVEAQLAAATDRLTSVTADLQRAEAKYSATSSDLDVAKRELTDRAVTAYIRQPTVQIANVLLESQTFRQVAAIRDFLHSVYDAQAQSVGRYRSLQEAIDGERRSLGELRDQAATDRDTVDQQRTELLAARAQRDGLRLQASAEEGKQKELLADVKGRVKEFEAQIASLKKESDAIAALLRARQRSQPKGIVPSGKGVLGLPVSGSITSGFGMRVHPIFETVRMHTGVDFSASTGTPVHAAEAGVIAVASERGGYGITVIVDHENGLATLYAHLSRTAVSPGARVAKGDVVGFSGSTGNATGPHLPFEVRVNGNPVDPMRYL
jgi:murein DD-endopeptidase MepM/ murein hydrolase activator NlpD